jgi:hypothetical protein
MDADRTDTTAIVICEDRDLLYRRYPRPRRTARKYKAAVLRCHGEERALRMGAHNELPPSKDMAASAPYSAYALFKALGARTSSTWPITSTNADTTHRRGIRVAAVEAGATMPDRIAR